MADKAGAAVLDFTNTREGGAAFNKKRVPAGDYLAKVTAVKDAPTKDTKEAQWLFTFELVEKYTDRKFPYYCKLVENQLWKVRNLCLAAGFPVPKRKVKLDPNKLVGKTIGITLDDDEYEGKLQSTVTQTFPAAELDGDSGGPDDEEEVDEETEDDEEVGEEAEEEEADEEPEDDEEEDEEEEEPEPAPKRRTAKAAPTASIPGQRKSSPTAAKRKPAPKAEEVDDDELEELDLDEI